MVALGTLQRNATTAICLQPFFKFDVRPVQVGPGLGRTEEERGTSPDRPRETDSTARKHPWLWCSQTVHTRDLAQIYLFFYHQAIIVFSSARSNAQLGSILSRAGAGEEAERGTKEGGEGSAKPIICPTTAFIGLPSR